MIRVFFPDPGGPILKSDFTYAIVKPYQKNPSFYNYHALEDEENHHFLRAFPSVRLVSYGNQAC